MRRARSGGSVWVRAIALLIVAAMALSVLVALAPLVAAQTGRYVEQFPSPSGTGNVIALTFDDGPDPRYTAPILDILAAKGVPATFFWLGGAVQAHPDLVRRAAAGGHSVQGHTWNHADLTRTGDFDGQIDRTNNLISSITGSAVRCVRPPYGATNASVESRLASRGITQALWSVETNDYRKPGVQAIVDRAVAGMRPGAVILMHDGGGDRSQTVAALSRIIDAGRARGFEFVSLCGEGVRPVTRDMVVTGVAPDGMAAGYALDSFGQIHSFGGTPAVQPSVTWPGRHVARAFAQRADGTSGYVLDRSGGLHPYGGAPPVQGTGYWPDQDVARDVALRADGTSGYVLDRSGGVHPFGGAPPILGSAYWPGEDVARRLVLRADGQSGYVVDAAGGVHSVGGSPEARGTGYWPGQDLLRDVVLRPDGVSGYVLDAHGGLHPFGGAPPIQGSGWWPEQDAARSLVLKADGVTGWVVDLIGGMHPFGPTMPPTDLVASSSPSGGGGASVPPAGTAGIIAAVQRAVASALWPEASQSS